MSSRVKFKGKGSTGPRGTQEIKGRHGNIAKHKRKSNIIVTFDADKRKEYLTGFHKRKQERRRFGLDMEAYKQKKRQLERRKQHREETKQKLKDMGLIHNQSTEITNTNETKDPKDTMDDESDEESNEKITQYDDIHTKEKFGDVVTVVTTIGTLPIESEDYLSDSEDSQDIDEEEKEIRALAREKLANKQEKTSLSLFQRIQLQRKGKALPSKRSKLREARTSRNAMLANKKLQKSKAKVKKNGLSLKRGVHTEVKAAIEHGFHKKQRHG